MKKFLLSVALFASLVSSAQVTIFEDSFDTYDDFLISGFGDWQTLDLDLLTTYTGGATPPTWANANAAQAFQIFNPTAALVTNATNGVGGSTESRNFDPRTGLKYAASWASSPSTTGGATANEDWLISPSISLVGATGASLSIWVKSMSNSYGLEKYRIGVYTGTGMPTATSDFTIISGLLDLTAPYPAWAERTQSLATYQGQTIKIGIQCKTPDAYMFMVDDFKVTATSVLGTESFLSSAFTIAPNPANNFITVSNTQNILINEVKISDLNGRVVKQIGFDKVSNLNINVSDLASGVYMMNITSDKGSLIKKIIKN